MGECLGIVHVSLMKFSLVDGIRREPEPKLKGFCCCCGSAAQSKCGNRKVWHWSHVSRDNCDAWWENETEWHRLWKSYFPVENQEIVHFDEITGEKHIADIKTNEALVIEVQNSPMSELEMQSRESFYQNMLWIVNGEKFKKSFFIAGKLPDPNSEIAQKVRFTSKGIQGRCMGDEPSDTYENLAVNHTAFHFRELNPDYEEMLVNPALYEHGCMIESRPSEWGSTLEEMDDAYVGHHLFRWKNPRQVWSQATKAVFFDFGGPELWQLVKYDDIAGPWCVKRKRKRDFIREKGGVFRVSSEAAF
jgi:competence protein CoiA